VTLGILCVIYQLAASRIRVELQFHSNPASSQLTQHARSIPSAVCGAPPADEQVMLETCTGP
jgi:hypothetical protein